jgi:opacity protein-like surface antigen
MNHNRVLGTGFRISLLIMTLVVYAHAQAPDYDLQRTENEKDSLATVEYPYIFPLFGENVVRKGFDLPLPVGISISYYQQNAGVIIDGVSLGLGNEQLMPLTFVEFEDVANDALNLNTRLDVWLFPFLNIYGMLGYAKSDANVTLNAPFAFETAVDFTGWTYGGGVVLAFGLQGFWATANGNLAWTDMADYYDPVRATVLSFRLGRTLRLITTRGFQIWMGAMYQDPESTVNGRFLLADIISEELQGQFQDYYLTEWYNALSPEEQQFIDAFVQTMMQGSTDTKLDYQAEQHPKHTWNMLAGAQLALTERWNVQAEAGFLGSRTSLLVNLNYRLPL